MRLQIEFILLLTLSIISCRSPEEKRLQEALEVVQAEQAEEIDPYDDPYFVERSRNQIRQAIDSLDKDQIRDLYMGLDDRGKELMLFELDDETREEFSKMGKARGQEQEQIVMEVFFGTNRTPDLAKESSAVFEKVIPDDSLYFGKIRVNIPPIHVLGQIEKPSFLKLEFSLDEEKHMFIKELDLLDETNFVSSLQDSSQTFIFIHGYNTSFEDAALRTAQMAYDLSYPGVPMFYSWPSRGNLEGYFLDESAVEDSEKYLFQFLETVARSGKFEKINVVAHSMGNRATVKAMVEFSQQFEEPLFNHLVLAAPDVDANVFINEIGPFLSKSAQDVTLYSSENDLALRVSSLVNDVARAGQAGENILVVPGIETVDASVINADLLGHGYFYNSWILVDDVYKLVVNDQKADIRELNSQPKDQLKYWYLTNE